MKKILLLAVAAFAFVACTDEDTTPTNPSGETADGSLSRIETLKYNDLGITLENKRIQYFENGDIVGDTLFDAAGTPISRIVHERNGNIYIKKNFTMGMGSDFLASTTTYEYDEMGRLTLSKTDDGEFVKEDILNYENDVITISFRETHTGGGGGHTGVNTLKLDEQGRIVEMHIGDMEDPALDCMNIMIYEGNKAVGSTKYLYETQQNILMAFDYYEDAMPADIIKSVVQINNTLLENFRTEQSLIPLAINSNYFIKTLTFLDGDIHNFDKQFNETGHLISDKRSVNDQYRTDTFYYYNN